MVGERGTSLSGGQRQRLTLARALAGQSAAADPGRRDQRGRPAGGGGDPCRAAGRRAAPASVLVVAYRRATIALADEVVYIEHGRVVGPGTHPHLLATVPGYANLVTAYEKAEAERERERAYDEDAESVEASL